MTGDPLTTSYFYSLVGENVDVDITLDTAEPTIAAVTTVLTASPAVVEPNTPTLVTFTLVVTNYGVATHEIDRVEMDPHAGFNPDYVIGSTSGITTADPTVQGGRWVWDLWPYVAVPPYGKQVTMQFGVIVDRPVGSYRMEEFISIQGGGEVHSGRYVEPGQAPEDDNVLVTSLGDITIQTTVTPSLVPADRVDTFDVEMTITNTGSNHYDLSWIRYFASREFDYVDGSTSGEMTFDPQKSGSGSDDRWKYEWELGNHWHFEAGKSVQVRFQMVGAPEAGQFYSFSSVRVDEQGGPPSLFSAATGPAAPITVGHTFTVVADDNGNIVTIDALLAGDTVQVLSWDE